MPEKIIFAQHIVSFEYFFMVFSGKIRLDVSCESSARQRIHMTHQTLFSWKDRTQIRMSSLQLLFGAIRVKQKNWK